MTLQINPLKGHQYHSTFIGLSMVFEVSTKVSIGREIQ